MHRVMFFSLSLMRGLSNSTTYYQNMKNLHLELPWSILDHIFRSRRAIDLSCHRLQREAHTHKIFILLVLMIN